MVGVRGGLKPDRHDDPCLADGGHVRVGLEDNLYLEKGLLAKSSGEQVGKLRGIATALRIETATSTEARKILGLKEKDWRMLGIDSA